MTIRITQLPVLQTISNDTVFLVAEDYVSYQLNGTSLKSYLLGIGVGANTNTVAYANNLTFDLSLGQVQKVVLNGNTAFSQATNGDDGVEYTFVVVQNTVGGWSFTWPTNFLGSGIIQPNFDSALPNYTSVQKFIYDQTADVFFATTSMISYPIPA